MSKENNLLLTVLLMASFILTLSCQANQVPPISEPSEVNSSRNGGVVTAIHNMIARRSAHTATLLKNGKVLIAGGFVSEEKSLASAEIFDPGANSFFPTSSMIIARLSHTATLLPNGKVLIAGGMDHGAYLSSAELYDPVTGTFVPGGRMVTARSGHTATLLPNGKVLLAGGTGKGWTFWADAELYDPATNTFTPTGSMTTARESHTATLLNNGKVLITGGHQGRRSAIIIYNSAEIYEPTTGVFTLTGSLTVKRHKHDATIFTDGQVLITGGSDERDGEGAYRSAEVYNPATGVFRATSNLNVPRYKHQGTSVLLKNGKVVIAGGADSVEIYDPATRSFSVAKGSLGTKRLFSTATLLLTGEVLITGGYGQNVSASAGAWVYHNRAPILF